VGVTVACRGASRLVDFAGSPPADSPASRGVAGEAVYRFSLSFANTVIMLAVCAMGGRLG